jgi:exopolysaccharide production protein ExoZ
MTEVCQRTLFSLIHATGISTHRSPEINKPSTIYTLQVYRAIAAILVVLFHTTVIAQNNYQGNFFGGIFSFGYTGVDFFFVLSGFIIFYASQKWIGCPSRFTEYLQRRIIRIYPIYWTVTAMKIAIIFVIPSVAKSYERDPAVIIKSLILVPQQNLPIIGVGWTLSYEILFYLLFGVAILLNGRWLTAVFVSWALAIIGYAFVLNVARTNLPQNYIVGFLFNERNLEFLLGCVAAYIVLNGWVKRGGFLAAIGAILYLFWGFLLNANNGNAVLPFSPTFGVASFLLILGSASLEMNDNIRWPKLLVYLGDASYSIYLTHALAINAAMLVFGKLGFMNSGISLNITAFLLAIFGIVGGSLVHLLIEKPLLDLLDSRKTGKVMTTDSVLHAKAET